MQVPSAIIPAIFFLFLFSIVETAAQQSIPSTKNVPVSNFATCGNMGGENGWDAWTAEIGLYTNGTITVTASGVPTGPRFVLTTGGSIDSCTFGVPPGVPVLPVVAPGFGTRSIRLGQLNTNGRDGGCKEPGGFAEIGCAERLSYPFTVTPADSNFIYAYAIVLENPIETPPSHPKDFVPYAEIYILEQNGDTVQCSHQKYSGSTTGTNVIPPGFYAAACQGPATNGHDVVYKPWTTAGINLSKYIGQILKVVITNVDCGRGGHFCHSYWDFACPPIGASPTSFCAGNSTTIVGPASDPANPYVYTWYQNGTLYTGPPGAGSVSITPTPNAGDTFSVHVQPQSGCDFWIPYVPVSVITSSFASTDSSGIVDFTDLSITSNGSSLVAWQWNFPGGSPSYSSEQNPLNISYPPGTYTVCLTTTNQSGCKDTSCKAITITVTGIEDYLLPSAIKVSPNPSSGNLVIDFGSRDFGNAKVFFNDMVGNILSETTISAHGKQALNVSAFSKGIYSLQLKTEYGSTVKKIVITP